MEANYIITPKIGRYYKIENSNNNIKNILFVLHGYGQLAKEFIENFETLKTNENIIIAPEALNRFYTKGFYGSVGASWMTKEDRENDIKDYLNFLNNVYNKENALIFSPALKINILGFSQGTATAIRWVLQNKVKAENVILWGGSFPRDADYKKASIIFKSTKLTLVFGTEDEFISTKIIKEEQDILDQNKISFTTKEYIGKHEIIADVLKELL